MPSEPVGGTCRVIGRSEACGAQIVEWVLRCAGLKASSQGPLVFPDLQARGVRRKRATLAQRS